MKSKIVSSALFVLVIVFSACSSNSKIDRTQAPKPSEAPVINIPKPVSFTLDNGLKVFVVENHKLPKVSFQLTVDTDPVLENDKVGLSDLTGELMAEGTTTKTKSEIDAEIDFIGASLYTYAGGVYVSSLTKHADKVLDIASDIILNPSFPEEQLAKKKRKMISGMKMISSNANAIASRVGKVLKYGRKHPFGEIQLKEHIENLNIEDCKKHYATYFRPNVSYLVVVGDITPEEAKTKAEKYFGSWQKQVVPKHQYNFPKRITENRVVFVEKVGAVQSLIQVMYPLDYKVGAENAASVSVMSSVFGGAFSSYLNANLREDKAYTYGAGGGVRANRLVGSFGASASVRNEVTDSSIVEFLAEMKHIVNQQVSEKDLTRIKNNMNGNFALSLEKPKTIARFALNTARYNLPEDYYQNYLARLAAVNVESVQKAAKKYIKPEACIILVIGNKEVLESLKQFDADGVVEVLDINGEPKRELRPAPANMTAEKVIEQNFFARTDLSDMKSVRAKFAEIKDLTIITEAEMQGISLKMETVKMRPNYVFIDASMNGTSMQKQVCDGVKAFSTTPKGKQELTGFTLEKLKEETKLFPELDYNKSGNKISLLGIETIRGEEGYKVEVVNVKGETSYEYYALKTGLLYYTSSVIKGPDGKPFSTAFELSDYKNVNGILFPFTRSEKAGEQVVDLVVKSITMNTGVSKDIFN